MRAALAILLIATAVFAASTQDEVLATIKKVKCLSDRWLDRRFEIRQDSVGYSLAPAAD